MRTIAISIDGIPGAALSVQGQETAKEPVMIVPPEDTGAARVLISVSPEALKNLPHGEILNFEFKVRDTEDASEVTRAATFRKPT